MSTYPYGNGHLSGVGWRAVTHTIPHGHLLVGRGVREGQLLTSCQHTHKVTVTSAVGGGGEGGGWSEWRLLLSYYYEQGKGEQGNRAKVVRRGY